MSDCQTDVAALRQHLLQTENDIIDLNRQITAAVVAELTTGGLSAELAEIIEARDSVRARLSRLEGKPHG